MLKRALRTLAHMIKYGNTEVEDANSAILKLRTVVSPGAKSELTTDEFGGMFEIDLT